MRDLIKRLQVAAGIKSPDNVDCSHYDHDLLTEIKIKTLMEKGYNKNIPLEDARFTVFDLETTGLHPYGGDEIISISAILIENGDIKTNLILDTLVNPGREIPMEITKITGITNEMVKSAPLPLIAINDFLDFASQSVLVAHNSDFDMHFLNLKLRQYCQTKIYHPIVDTFALSNIIFSREKLHTLDHLIAVFNLSGEGRHTSLGDAYITSELLTILLDNVKSRGVRTIQDLIHYLRWHSTHH